MTVRCLVNDVDGELPFTFGEGVRGEGRVTPAAWACRVADR